MTDYPRSAWTDRAPRYTTAFVASEVQGVAIHWNGPPVGTSDVAAYLRGVQRYHMDTKGWADIAYNLAVDQAGNVWVLRGLYARSGANGATTPNRTHLAILAVLGEGQRPTAAMLAGIRRAVSMVRGAYPHGRAIRTHNDVRPTATACPGPDLTHAVRVGLLEPSASPAPAPAPTPAPSGPRTLRRGMTGPDVRDWQTVLRGAGYAVTVDGAFGPATEAATVAFQRVLRVTPDGAVGPATRAAVAALLAYVSAASRPPAPAPVPSPAPSTSYPTLRLGATGQAVRVAQLRLVYHGLRLTVDGVFGSSTEANVRTFQRAKGLAADGIVGPRTWAYLWEG